MKLNNLITKVLGVFAVVGLALGTISCDKGGEDPAPPVEEGGDAAPAEGGGDAAPAEGGDAAAPAEGGDAAAPAEGGDAAAPAEGGGEG